jgi:hypothetical membrane protein
MSQVRGHRDAAPAAPTSRHRRLLALGGAAGIAGALLYSSFLLAGLVGSRLDPTTAFISELGVPGQPASGLFRLADALAGVFIIGFAVTLLHRLAGDRYAAAGSLCLMVLGLASIGDGRHPMPCTPSTDRWCRHQLDEVPLAVQLHQWHTFTSVAGVLAGIAAMALLGRSPAAARWSARLPRLCGALAAAVAAIAGLEVPLTQAGLGVGALERTHVVLLSAWIAVLAGYLLRELRKRRRWPLPRPRGRPL